MHGTGNKTSKLSDPSREPKMSATPLSAIRCT